MLNIISNLNLDTDFGRDLSEMSRFWIGQKIVWLGPRLSLGFHASPIYYYIFYPALYFSNGNIYSVIFLNILFFLISILVFCLYLFRNKSLFLTTILFFIFLITNNWWIGLALHPGNGYTYVFWLFISLVLCWYDVSLFISSLLLGLATSFHPAAIFAIVFLIDNLSRIRQRVVGFLKIFAGIIIPWFPIILFEIVTKGYLVRSYLSQKHESLNFLLSIVNIQAIFSSFGNISIFIFLIFLSIAMSNDKRLKRWFYLSIFCMLPFLFVPLVPSHYLYGLTTIIWFLVLIRIAEFKYKNYFLIILIIFSVSNTYLNMPNNTNKSFRPISKILQNVDVLKSQLNIDKNIKLAVVSVIDNTVKVPQADDYRFFLRINGYRVLEVLEYAQAEYLLLIVEDKKFDWHNWSSWEMDQIGSKKILKIFENKNAKFILYSKN